MGSSIKKSISAPAFAPSPPPSAGPSDCEHDADSSHDGLEAPVVDADADAAGGEVPRARRCTRAQVGSSSPSSTASRRVQPRSAPPAAALSSFTSDDDDARSFSKPLSQDPHPHRAGEPAAREVDQAFSLVEASWREELPGSPAREWEVFLVSPSEYDKLCDRLQEEDPRLLDHFDSQVRYDYDPDRGILVLRLMASAVHDVFQDLVCGEIKTQLRAIAAQADDPVVAEVASHIITVGHARFKLGPRRKTKTPKSRAIGQKSPDGQFLFTATSAAPQDNPRRPWQSKPQRLPQFVLEVGYSQRADSLEQLAVDYYEKSSGKIKTVLNFDIEYASGQDRKQQPAPRNNNAADGTEPGGNPDTPGSGNSARRAVLSLYRGPERIHGDAVFRDASGSPAAGSLQLVLADFVPDRVVRQLSTVLRDKIGQASIDVPFSLLNDFLTQAEAIQALEDADTTESESGLDVPPADGQSAKRKSVGWDRKHARYADAEEGGASTSSSKRRRTDASAAQDDQESPRAGLPERRRTRSISRLHG